VIAAPPRPGWGLVAVSSATSTPTQTLTGGGKGAIPFDNPGQLLFDGKYGSNGQLGDGHFSLQVGQPGNPARFAHGLLLVNVTAQIRSFAQLHQHEPTNVVSNILTDMSASSRWARNWP